MSEELKNCPFCGEHPQSMHEHNQERLPVIVWCECDAMKDCDYMYKEQWNTRADNTTIIEVSDFRRGEVLKHDVLNGCINHVKTYGSRSSKTPLETVIAGAEMSLRLLTLIDKLEEKRRKKIKEYHRDGVFVESLGYRKAIQYAIELIKENGNE